MMEIVDSIKQQLESEGALNAIRAQLKACVLGVLASTEDGRPKAATSRASTFVEDKTGAYITLSSLLVPAPSLNRRRLFPPPHLLFTRQVESPWTWSRSSWTTSA